MTVVLLNLGLADVLALLTGRGHFLLGSPELTGALWRIVLFQMYVSFQASISIDVTEPYASQCFQLYNHSCRPYHMDRSCKPSRHTITFRNPTCRTSPRRMGTLLRFRYALDVVHAALLVH